MVHESTSEKRKRVFNEIHKKYPNINDDRPYSTLIHDQSAVNNECDITATHKSLQAAIRSLLELLDNEPGCTGEIFMYERKKRQSIYKILPQ